MTRNEYNGWTNYETWAVALWMDNDQASHEYWHDVARQCAGAAESACSLLARSLKDGHEEALPELAGFAADLLNGAMAEVNWYEIAKNLLDAVSEAQS